MRRTLSLLAFVVVLLISAAGPSPAFAGLDDGIAWLGHASFRLERKHTVVYVDPWQIATEPHDADAILITHPHFDHLSPSDIGRVAKASTVIVGPPECLKGLTGTLRPVKPGDHVALDGISVDVVPAYNTGTAYHPKANQWVGYLVQLDGGPRIYHAGDTDVIPEMSSFKVDVALLPVGGTYTMTAEQAAMAANLLDPKLAIPMHYGSIVGGPADAQRFQEACGSIPVKILPRRPPAERPAPDAPRRPIIRGGTVL